MARREARHHDDETGVTTRTVSFAGKMTADEGSEFDSLGQHVILGNTSVDYVIGEDERALRDGRWAPDNAAELLAAINHLRHCLRNDDIPHETLAVAALRVGRLHTEAVAKQQWPIVHVGRARRRQVKAWSLKGAAARRNTDQALTRDVIAYRNRHPGASSGKIARVLHPAHGAGLKLDSLRKRIDYLLKK